MALISRRPHRFNVRWRTPHWPRLLRLVATSSPPSPAIMQMRPALAAGTSLIQWFKYSAAVEEAVAPHVDKAEAAAVAGKLGVVAAVEQRRRQQPKISSAQKWMCSMLPILWRKSTTPIPSAFT